MISWRLPGALSHQICTLHVAAALLPLLLQPPLPSAERHLPPHVRVHDPRRCPHHRPPDLDPCLALPPLSASVSPSPPWSVDDKSQAGTSITSTNHMFGFMTPDVVLTIVLQCTSIRVSHCRPSVHPCLRVHLGVLMTSPKPEHQSPPPTTSSLNWLCCNVQLFKCLRVGLCSAQDPR